MREVFWMGKRGWAARCVLAACLLSVILSAAAAAEEAEPRLNLQLQAEPLSQVLELLARSYGLQYTLHEAVDPNLPITSSLVGVTVDQALRVVLAGSGLVAVEQDGQYAIHRAPSAPERPTDLTSAVPMAVSTRPAPPPPVRPRAYAPGAAAAPSAGEAQDEEEEQLFQIMWPRYIGAGLASAIFGGGMIDAGAALGGGSGSYGGGYGGSSYGGGYGSGSGSYGGGYGGGGAYGAGGSTGTMSQDEYFGTGSTPTPSAFGKVL